MNYYKIPSAFLIWAILYFTVEFMLLDGIKNIYQVIFTGIYLFYMSYQLYLLHKSINKEKEEDKIMIDKIEKCIKNHETYIKQQIAILESVEKQRDTSIKRLN